MPQLSSPAWREDITVGEEVIRQGDSKADFCYIIQSGEFAVIIDGKVVGHLSKGNCFGELSLLYSAPRTATIKATKNSSIWVLPRGWLKTAAQESAAARHHSWHCACLRASSCFKHRQRYLELLEFVTASVAAPFGQPLKTKVLKCFLSISGRQL